MKIKSRDIKKLIDTLKKQKEKEKSGKKKKDSTKDLNINEILLLQKEAYDTAREMGSGIMESLKQADLVKEEINIAKTGVKKRYTGIMKLLGADSRVADAFGTMFGKKISKDEQEALKKKYGMVEKKDNSAAKAKKEAAAIKELTKKTFDLLSQMHSMLNGVRLTVLGIANKIKARAAKEVEIKDGKYFDTSGKRLRKKDVEKGSGATYSKEAKRFKDIKTGKFISGVNAMSRMNIAKPASSVPALASKVLSAKKQELDVPKLVDDRISDEAIEKSQGEFSKNQEEFSERIFKSIGEDPLLSIHNKLDLILAKTASDLFSDLTDGPDRKGKNNKRTPKNKGRFGRIARFANAAKNFVGTGAGTAVIAGAGAVAVTGAGFYALNKGMTKAGEESKGKMDVLESKYGLKTIYDKGKATGYEVRGKKYGLNDLPQEYKDLIEAYGPGDKRSFSAREALKRIKANEAKYKALETSSQPAVAKPAVAAAPSPPPTTAPAAPTVTASPASPPPSAPAAAPTVSREATSMPAATPALFNGNAPDLKQVVTTQNSGVNIDDINPGFEDRLSRMAAAFKSVTGKKLMITSGVRTDAQQLELWNAKYAEIKAANPNASEDEIRAKTRKWVALPAALGGKGSKHAFGTATDINSKGASGIEAINGMEFNGQKVTTDSFLAMFGLQRPLKHEPWHLQPAGDVPTPDNPDPNAKGVLVADATGKPVDLESGKKETLPTQSATESGKAATPTPIVASAAAPTATPSAAPTATPALASTTPPPAAPTATPVAPMPVTGDKIAAETTAVTSAKETMTAQLSKPTVVAPPAAGKSGQMPAPPAPSAGIKAEPRHTEDAFSRALAKDFAHPSTFTSVRLV